MSLLNRSGGVTVSNKSLSPIEWLVIRVEQYTGNTDTIRHEIHYQITVIAVRTPAHTRFLKIPFIGKLLSVCLRVHPEAINKQ